MSAQADSHTARALAQMSLANATLFFSLVDAVLTAPSERTPKRIAEYVRMNYAALGEQRSEAADALVELIASRLEGAETEAHGADRAV